MNPPDPQGGPSESTSSNGAEEEQGAGCLPGILAAMALCGILGFITCGAMTWYIFANQDQLALRALNGSFIPAVEQSFLNPEEKSNTVDQLKEFAKEIERGQVENWQIAGVMQRMDRLPVLSWGQARWSRRSSTPIPTTSHRTLHSSLTAYEKAFK